ncbi:MAG: hypothetical protein WC843_06180 [Candidatus Gracilibacteria bacterium]|jgi:hypothetical protein
MKKIVVPVLITAVVVGGLSFYGGMQYQQSTLNAQRQQRTGSFGGAGGIGAAGFGGAAGVRGQAAGMINGDIISSDDKSITVKTRDGGSKIVFFSGSTGITKSVDGVASDLATGKTVIVSGTANSDGSVTAQTIQLRPQAPAGTPNTTSQQTQTGASEQTKK